MADQEKFSILKFFSSFTQWLPWVKTLRYVIGAIAILAIIFTIYKAFFKKDKPTQDINVQSGGLVNVINEANKRHLILFAEPYFQVSTKSEENANVGCRIGVRWEF
jgi:Ni,Fe-hydrogenase I cytochrome b subunit